MPQRSKKKLFISVVVPAYNEEKSLAKCIEALLNQNYPKTKYEIVVVNNNSTDHTAQIAAKYPARLVFQKKRGIIWAKQAGCMATKGPLIAITDADTIVPTTWLNEINHIFSDSRLAGLTGPAIPQNLPLWGKAVYFSGLWMLIALSKLKLIITIHGQNTAFWKKYFLSAGGFNTNIPIGEDEIGLLTKLKKYGRVLYCPKLKVITSGRRFSAGMYLFARQMIYNYWLGYIINKTFNKTIIPPYRNIRD